MRKESQEKIYSSTNRTQITEKQIFFELRSRRPIILEVNNVYFQKTTFRIPPHNGNYLFLKHVERWTHLAPKMLQYVQKTWGLGRFSAKSRDGKHLKLMINENLKSYFCKKLDRSKNLKYSYDRLKYLQKNKR